MFSMLAPERLAAACARRPGKVVALWALMLAAGVTLFVTLFDDAVTTEFKSLDNPESSRAAKLLREGFGRRDSVKEVVVITSPRLTVEDAAFREYVERLYDRIVRVGAEAVAGASHYYQGRDEALVSKDRRATIMPVVMAGNLKDAVSNVEKVHRIIDDAASSEFDVYITGESTFSQDFTKGAEEDLVKGESFALPVALVILALVFGALAAALLPIILAVGAVAIALGLAALVGQAFELHVFVQNVITGIGLAVGIDYTLFIVSRYREERARGLAKVDAITAAGATAGRAVLFSGLTVVVALMGLLIVPQGVFVSLGIGSILVVVIAVMASLTLLPAALSIMGDSVNKYRIPLPGRLKARSADMEGGFWDRVTYAVMRRPLISLVVAAGVMIAASVSYFDINTGTSGVSTFPDDFRAKRGFEALQRDFGFGLNAPAEIVIGGDVDSDQVRAALQRLQAALGSDPRFGPSSLEVNEARDTALLSVPLVGDAVAADTIRAVRELRREYVPQAFSSVPAKVLVTGTTAEEMDINDTSDSFRPIVFAAVLGLSFLLLMLVFRSLVIPVKAIVMNLLSVGAAYGLLVLVFQKGVGNELLGFRQVDVIQSWIPIMLFAILFGLSMDYHVFLITRIRERFDRTHDNDEAVAYGLRTTAGLITGAALIMVTVFSGFALGNLVQLQQFGFGMAVAILLDATIVRTILVPATMKLLGAGNWYLPHFMGWMPHLRVEGGGHIPPTGAGVP